MPIESNLYTLEEAIIYIAQRMDKMGGSGNWGDMASVLISSSSATCHLGVGMRKRESMTPKDFADLLNDESKW